MRSHSNEITHKYLNQNIFEVVQIWNIIEEPVHLNCPTLQTKTKAGYLLATQHLYSGVVGIFWEETIIWKKKPSLSWVFLKYLSHRLSPVNSCNWMCLSVFNKSSPRAKLKPCQLDGLFFLFLFFFLYLAQKWNYNYKTCFFFFPALPVLFYGKLNNPQSYEWCDLKHLTKYYLRGLNLK